MTKIEMLNLKAKQKNMLNKKGVQALNRQSTISLTLYRNGFKFMKMPYYPYHSQIAIEVMTDIFDGFFPQMLKRKYLEILPI